jgi:alpha-glucosidase
MNRPRAIAVRVLFAIALSIGVVTRGADEVKPAAAAAAAPVDVRSPDGQVMISLRLREGGQPVYRVTYRGKVVVDDSPLGLTFAARDGGSFHRDLTIAGVEHTQADETYPVIAGKTATARDHYNQATVNLARSSGSQRATPVQVVLRAYDDGAAFRYQFPGQDAEPLTIASEDTTFNLPADAKAWVLPVPNFTSHYEYLYDPKKVAEIGAGKLIGLPLLLECAEGGPAIAITEANLTDYAGMYLERADAGTTTLRSRLSPRPDKPGIAVELTKRRVSPWRVILLAESAGKLIESNLVSNLNDPCAIADTSWIKPGKVAFLWWNGYLIGHNGVRGAVDTNTFNHYVDAAAEFGFPYSSIDGLDIAWYGGKIPGYHGEDITKPVAGLDIQAVLDHAKKKGVRIRLWVASQALRANLDRALETYQRWGVEGIMVDFIERDDQEMVNWVREMVEKAAAHRLTVTLHNVSKPTGLSRTYPNLLTREAVRNQEWDKWDAHGVTPEHNVTVPFTRMLAGPLDYHAGGFRNVRTSDYAPRDVAPDVMGTRCHQLAMYVVYDDPMPMAVDYPAAYRGRPGIDVLRDVPTTWDETRFIDGKVGQYIVIARRKDDVWYLASMTNDTPREVKVSLTFLGDGRFVAERWADDIAAGPNGLAKSSQDVTAHDTLHMKLAPAGGQVMRLVPARR